MQSLQFSCDHTNVLPALWHFNLIDRFHAHGIGKCMGMGANPAHALHQNQRLDGIALCGDLFNTTVIVPDEDLCVFDHLSLGIERSMYRLLQSGMIGSDWDDIAHFVSSFSVPFSLRSSESGLTMIWPLP